jgi:hypothetical protein
MWRSLAIPSDGQHGGSQKTYLMSHPLLEEPLMLQCLSVVDIGDIQMGEKWVDGIKGSPVDDRFIYFKLNLCNRVKLHTHTH